MAAWPKVTLFTASGVGVVWNTWDLCLSCCCFSSEQTFLCKFRTSSRLGFEAFGSSSLVEVCNSVRLSSVIHIISYSTLFDTLVGYMRGIGSINMQTGWTGGWTVNLPISGFCSGWLWVKQQPPGMENYADSYVSRTLSSHLWLALKASHHHRLPR